MKARVEGSEVVVDARAQQAWLVQVKSHVRLNKVTPSCADSMQNK